mmetsp:Transcript_21736/g.49459  ORF Transcript_21736/g.49459 Transcript_21736/m.49459 type:complete len:92 (+) Transcript_21736:401-676(+)
MPVATEVALAPTTIGSCGSAVVVTTTLGELHPSSWPSRADNAVVPCGPGLTANLGGLVSQRRTGPEAALQPDDVAGIRAEIGAVVTTEAVP